MFPSYYSFVISAAFDGRIKYTNKSGYAVSNKDNACVEPFAQTDVANTVIRGIDDELRKKFYESYNASITVLRNEIISQLDSAGAPEVLKKRCLILIWRIIRIFTLKAWISLFKRIILLN